MNYKKGSSLPTFFTVPRFSQGNNKIKYSFDFKRNHGNAIYAHPKNISKFKKNVNKKIKKLKIKNVLFNNKQNKLKNLILTFIIF